MSARTHTIGSPASRSVPETLGGVGFAVMGVVAAVTALLSAATVWLVLTRPLAVAHALGEREATEMARALAGLMVSMLRDLISYL
ncbi:MAG: hypothetical protein IMZ44_11660 [Planctomycetes bacterium]|nr:hypothetical protein [Planctomycetota bacterium]